VVIHADAKVDMSELHAFSLMWEQHCFSFCATNSGEISFKQVLQFS